MEAELFGKAIATTLALSAAFFVPNISSANPLCGARAGLVDKLEAKFGETRKGLGTIGDRAVFEVWSSDKTGSWTILFTRADGTACVMATGDNWQSMPAIRPVGDPA